MPDTEYNAQKSPSLWEGLSQGRSGRSAPDVVVSQLDFRHDAANLGCAFAKQVRQDQAAQFAATQRPTTEERPQRSTFFAAALLLFDALILAFVSLAQQPRYG